jgi:hypothetical protein
VTGRNTLQLLPNTLHLPPRTLSRTAQNRRKYNLFGGILVALLGLKSAAAHSKEGNKMKKTRTLLYLLVALIGIASFAGCSEQLPIMTVAQQTTYNDCMSGRWSGAADTFWWGPFGWAYHSSLVKDCLAKSGSLGKIGSAEAAPTTAVGSVQPAATSVTAATSGAQPSPSAPAH